MAEADSMEKHNDAMMGNLQNKISNLKNITIAIGDEVRDQNRALDEMQNGFGATDSILGSTMQKMGLMYKSHGSMSVVYLAIFAIVAFLVVYGMVKMGGR